MQDKGQCVRRICSKKLQSPNRCGGIRTNLVEKLPKELKASLPTVKEIEAELEQDIPSSEIQPQCKRREAARRVRRNK